MTNPKPLQTNSRSRSHATLLWLVGLLCLLAVAMLAYRGLYRGFTSGSDFGLYYCSTVAMVQTGDPYSPQPLRELAEQRDVPTTVIENAIAPPICYTPLLPFATMPWPAARVLWAIINLLAVVLIWYWLTDLAQIPRGSLSLGLLLLTLLVAGFAPLQTNIAFGQLAVTSTAAMIGSLAMARRGKTQAAALLFVLSGLLKPQLAIGFAIFWIYKRDWRILLYTAGYGILITALTVAWLQFKNPLWFEAWRANIDRLAAGGGASDYARSTSFIFADLRAPLYALLQSKPLAAPLAWLITLGLGALAYVRLMRKKNHRDTANPDKASRDLHVAGLIACLTMLPIYHVYYDVTILLIPAAWIIATLTQQRSTIAFIALLLFVPMLLPSQPILNQLEQQGFLPTALTDAPIYRGIVLLHLPWLIIGITLCMIFLRQRTAADQAP